MVFLPGETTIDMQIPISGRIEIAYQVGLIFAKNSLAMRRQDSRATEAGWFIKKDLRVDDFRFNKLHL